jgi:hypothetical protein
VERLASRRGIVAREPVTHASPTVSGTRLRVGFVLIAAAIGIIRLYECARLPSETGDVVRNLLHGLAVDAYGFAGAVEPLVRLSDRWSDVSWARLPYNYPPVALAFFALVAGISPTVFFAKLALTIIEGINALLVRRVSGSTALALVYWGSPLSLWWVSKEGQFEPLQAVFMLLALLVAASMPFLGGFFIGLGVSTKATAAALAPQALGETSRIGRRALALMLCGLAVGLLPLALAQFAYGGIYNIAHYSSPLVYNPYFWNPLAPMFATHPFWQNAANEIASYGFLIALVALALRDRRVLAYLAPVAFIVFCKVHTNVQPWYWVLMPAFLMTVPDPRARLALVALCPLLDLNSVYELVHGETGPVGFHGLPSVFAPYVLH